METSVMLVLDPGRVRLDKAVADGPFNAGPLHVRDLLHGQPYYIVNEFDEISRTGTIGMPEHASKEKGAQFLEAAANGVTAFIDDFSQWHYQEDASQRRRQIG
jgi:creatinine amidohydrolase/Fe(II)-dependent formamide hydrolase-like protein